MLESTVGWEKTQLAVQNYFNKWKFKHPQPADMQEAFEEAIGGKLSSFFGLIKKEGKFE
jgi:aminopeptidase N